LFILLSAAPLATDLHAATKRKKLRVKDLPRRFQTWIKKDVGYIITDWEKKVFLQLENDQEREMFIEMFWKNRDPNPYTKENEYKIEHYDRMAYAEKRFSKGTPTPGWRTERGRIHIILGEPHSLERYDSVGQLRETIIWFYQGLIKYGLPNAFYVVFFKEDNSGDFELYSPVRHGPHKLLVKYDGDTHDVMAAYRELNKIAPNVARVSVSLIEGEPPMSARPTMQSDILLGKKIVEAPKKRVNDEYAKRLLRYRNQITVEYSVNYIANSSKVKVLKDTKTGYYFIHYLVEPQKLSLEQFEDTLFGNLEIHGNIRDINGKTVYEFNKDAPIKLTPLQIPKVQGKLFSFQDFFPLIPGKYTLEILIRNTTSKEFTSVERTLVIPAEDKPGVGAVLMANKVQQKPGVQATEKPFEFGGGQLLLSPRDDFSANDQLHMFFQVHGLTPEQVQNGHFVYTLIKDSTVPETVKTEKKVIREYPGVQTNRVNFLEQFSLKGLPAAYYIMKVSVYGEADRLLYEGEGNFYISPVGTLKRPWVVSMTAPSNGVEHFNAVAIQYANKKDFQASMINLEKAYNRSPMTPKLALNYCQVLFNAKRYKKVKAVAGPFLQTPEKHKFLSYLGYSSANLGEYTEAITHFKDHLSHFGTNIKILNAIGECYTKLGENEEALVAWERSLQLFPDQEKLKARIKEVKKNKKTEAPKNEKNK
jgi:GWxTD domain-containing protein